MIGMVKRVVVRGAGWSRDQWVDIGREGALGGAWVDRDLRAAREAQDAQVYNARVVAAMEQRLVKENNPKRAKKLLANITAMRAAGDEMHARRVTVESAAQQVSAERIASEHSAIMRSGGYAPGCSPEALRARAERGRACRDAILHGAAAQGPRDDSLGTVVRDLVHGLLHKPPVVDCSALEQKTIS